MKKTLVEILDGIKSQGDLANMERICQAAVALAAFNGGVSTDDIRGTIEILEDKRVIGSALSYLSRNDVLTIVGNKSSTQEKSNSRPVSVFALTNEWRGNYLQNLEEFKAPAWMLDLVPKVTVTPGQDAVTIIESLLAIVSKLAALQGGSVFEVLPPSDWGSFVDAQKYVHTIATARAQKSALPAPPVAAPAPPAAAASVPADPSNEPAA
jgi:hypothetical protein